MPQENLEVFFFPYPRHPNFLSNETGIQFFSALVSSFASRRLRSQATNFSNAFVQAVLLVYFVITVCAVALLPDELQLYLGLPFIVIALLGLGAYAWLRLWLRPRFYFVDYIHGHK